MRSGQDTFQDLRISENDIKIYLLDSWDWVPRTTLL